LIEISDSDILELAAGRRPELEVGTIPYEVRKYLGCSRDTVFLSSDSMKHIVKKHGDHIGLESIKLIPKILFSGFWLTDDRSNHAIACFKFSEIRLKAVVKVTEDRRRAYLITLYKTSRRQEKALLRKTMRIRDGWNE